MVRRVGLVPLELAILRVTAAEPEVHGFGVARKLAEAHGSGLTAHGTLYKALSRLSDWGMLSAHWEPAEEAERSGRPRRRLYRITDTGRAALAQAAMTTADQTVAPLRRRRPRAVGP